MGKHKKKTTNGSGAKINGNDSPGKDTSLPHTDAPTSRSCTAPNTPDELSPAMAASRQDGHALKPDQTGTGKVDPSTNGKAAPLKNGKSHNKAAPLPPGFLESELQSHKRKLKLAEQAIDTHRQEIALMKRRLAAATAESQELRVAKEALESACKAATDSQQQGETGRHLKTSSCQWIIMGISVLSVSALVAVAATRSTALKSQWHPNRQ